MTASRWLAAAGLALCIGAPVSAQEAHNPETVLLAYKFSPGQTQRFRGSIRGSLNLRFEGGAVPSGELALKQSLLVTERVIGVKGETGTVRSSLDALHITGAVGGSSFSARLANGKLTASENGKPVPATHRSLTRLSVHLLKPGLTRRTTTGRVVQAGGGRQASSLLELPAYPVRVGDRWTSSLTTNVAVPSLDGRTRLGNATTVVQFQHVLKALERKNGRLYALIESCGTSSVPKTAGALQGLSQTLNGMTRFDVERGAVVSGEYVMYVDTQVQAPADATLSPEAPRAAAGSGVLDILLVEAAAAPPTEKPVVKVTSKAARAGSRPARRR